MRFKIHGGTPAAHGDGLCASCRYSRITRGQTLDEELVFCNASHFGASQITFKVCECSDYSDQTVPTYWDLMQQAWILQPASSKRKAGFVRASDMRDTEFERYMAGLAKRDEV